MKQETLRQLNQKSSKLVEKGHRLFEPQPGSPSRLLLSERGIVRRGAARSKQLVARLFGL
jgi:hypothetical protein